MDNDNTEGNISETAKDQSGRHSKNDSGMVQRGAAYRVLRLHLALSGEAGRLVEGMEAEHPEAGMPADLPGLVDGARKTLRLMESQRMQRTAPDARDCKGPYNHTDQGDERAW